MPALLASLNRPPELREVVQVPQQLLLSVAELVRSYQQAGVLVDEPPLHTVGTLLGPLLLGSMLGSVPGILAPPPPEPATYVARFLEGRRRPGAD